MTPMKLFSWGLAGVLGVVGIVTVGQIAAGLSSVVTAPSRVVTRTLETDNIISNYEWFHDAFGNYKSRVAQVKAHRQTLAEATDPAEKTRLRIEINAISQACRELANRYNANATKTNKSIFMGREAPESLDSARCEG